MQTSLGKKKNDIIKVVAVSYLNTLPFIYGLDNYNYIRNYELFLDIPSKCADMLFHNEVDVGLVPVGVLPHLQNYQIISDYCIGSVGEVRTVMLYSDVPLEKIDNIYLDYQSKTSIVLVQMLAEKFWKINPKWIHASHGYEGRINKTSAGVVIGDRTFNMQDKYKYAFDLGKAWYEYTNLPFVFACWVTKKQLSSEWVFHFNQAIAFGVNNKNNVIKQLENKYSREDMIEYYNKNISYELDANKKEGLAHFLSQYQTMNFAEKKKETISI